ncbi:MAG TPA: hypothetical protein VIO11_05160, partial [Candidatus Methanoperedens sp.]
GLSEDLQVEIARFKIGSEPVVQPVRNIEHKTAGGNNLQQKNEMKHEMKREKPVIQADVPDKAVEHEAKKKDQKAPRKSGHKNEQKHTAGEETAHAVVESK